MQQTARSRGQSQTGLLRRLDGIAGEINAVLIALAIGLAVLDMTCFVGLRASAEIARARAVGPPAGRLQPAASVTERLDFGSIAR